MELDEFKAHWNAIQDKEFQQQNISTERLEQIIMNVTDTMGHLHAKSVYWQKLGKFTSQMLIGALVIVLLIIMVRGFYAQSTIYTILASIAYLVVMVVYCIVTIWIYNRQEQIFSIYNSDNVKETLQQTIIAFKRFYLMFNIIYLFLYPAFYYAVIKLLITYWHPSSQTIFITIAIATAISLICGHWYYKINFFKKLESLEANLEYLGNEQ